MNDWETARLVTNLLIIASGGLLLAFVMLDRRPGTAPVWPLIGALTLAGISTGIALLGRQWGVTAGCVALLLAVTFALLDRRWWRKHPEQVPSSQDD